MTPPSVAGRVGQFEDIGLAAVFDEECSSCRSRHSHRSEIGNLFEKFYILAIIIFHRSLIRLLHGFIRAAEIVQHGDRGHIRHGTRLKSEPSAYVTVSVASTDTTEVTVDPATLTFTPGDWFAEKTVTVTGVDDQDVDGDILTLINIEMEDTADPNYLVVDPDNALVTNCDDGLDQPGIAVSAISGNTTEAGGQATFTVQLNTEPTAEVTVGEDEYGTDPNYDIPQGLLDFELPCADATVVFYYHGTSMEEAGESYRKFREGAQHGFFAFAGAAIGSAAAGGQTVPTATLTLADGQLGDLDNLINDRIRDPGGMARLDQAIPTLNDYGLMLLALGVGLLGRTK